MILKCFIKVVRSMEINEIKEILNANFLYLKENYHVNEIGIFCSFVKNQRYIHQDSDIDILISFKKGHKDFFNYMRLKIYLEKILNRKIDLVIKESVKSRLKEKIFKEVEYV